MRLAPSIAVNRHTNRGCLSRLAIAKTPAPAPEVTMRAIDRIPARPAPDPQATRAPPSSAKLQERGRLATLDRQKYYDIMSPPRAPPPSRFIIGPPPGVRLDRTSTGPVDGMAYRRARVALKKARTAPQRQLAKKAHRSLSAQLEPWPHTLRTAALTRHGLECR